MDVSTYLLFAFLGGLALVNLVQAQGQLGFISLDCGLPANTDYIEPTLTLLFTSDAAYINGGASKSLSTNYQEYLHDGCKPPIIHRDVKTTNILLTENLQAKLADFGLSKSFPVDGTNSKSYMSTIVAGTPHGWSFSYYISNRLTEKSDVYSFGVTLLEIISCRPVISRNEENVHISRWANSMVAQGNINGIADERLRGKYDVNSVGRAVEIAVNCVSRNSAGRPTMNQVVAELKSCLAIELERTPESRGFHSTNSVNMMSIAMDYSGSVPMAR